MLHKSTTMKVMELFFREPTKKHYLKGISRELGIAHTSVANALTYLLKKDLIIKETEKKGTRKFPFYLANFQDKYHKSLKRFYNAQQLMESGLIQDIEDKAMPRCIMLFGSYSRGEDTKDSDIDLFIESEAAEIDTKKIEKKLARKIEMHFNKDFKDLPAELKNNIINGIKLSGYLEGY